MQVAPISPYTISGADSPMPPNRPDDERLPPFELPVSVDIGGLTVRLRFVTPDDSGRILAGLREISPETSYHRFFTPRFVPNASQLRYLTHVDGDQHVAIAAVEASPDEPGIGVARYVRLDESLEEAREESSGDASVAEAAALVIDRYQGRGIGSLLLAAMNRHAYENGVRAFRAYVMEENRDVIEFLRDIGTVREVIRDGVAELDLPVYRSISDVPASPHFDRLRASWTLLQQALRKKEARP